MYYTYIHIAQLPTTKRLTHSFPILEELFTIQDAIFFVFVIAFMKLYICIIVTIFKFLTPDQLPQLTLSNYVAFPEMTWLDYTLSTTLLLFSDYTDILLRFIIYFLLTQSDDVGVVSLARFWRVFLTGKLHLFHVCKSLHNLVYPSHCALWCFDILSGAFPITLSKHINPSSQHV